MNIWLKNESNGKRHTVCSMHTLHQTATATATATTACVCVCFIWFKPSIEHSKYFNNILFFRPYPVHGGSCIQFTTCVLNSNNAARTKRIENTKKNGRKRTKKCCQAYQSDSEKLLMWTHATIAHTEYSWNCRIENHGIKCHLRNGVVYVFVWDCIFDISIVMGKVWIVKLEKKKRVNETKSGSNFSYALLTEIYEMICTYFDFMA